MASAEISSRKENSFGVTDLKYDTYYSFVGLYNKETKRLMGRFISEVKTIPVYFEGVGCSSLIFWCHSRHSRSRRFAGLGGGPNSFAEIWSG